MIQKKNLGLIGYPLSHSFSKKYFEDKFINQNIIDYEFNVYLLKEISEFPELINAHPSLTGLSVTLPHKETIIQYIDKLDSTAKEVGAVNCIKINHLANNKTELVGFNTDVFGFRQSIKPFIETHHERALILGTGGASKAVAFVLGEIGIDYYFVTRNKTDKKIINHNNKIFSYDEINEYIINAFKLIINTTPVGMFPEINTSPTLPYHLFTSSHLLYDLVYNPVETEFLNQGKLKGATTLNGLSMLHQQAEEAWRIWVSK